jgi:3-oxoacyl-[acyl-carrier protein] reductase
VATDFVTADTRRTAIVTGGGQGLGEAIARALSEMGMRVIVADISAGAADRVASALSDADSATVDVRDKDAMREMIERVHAAHGAVDVLVNNAAITLSRPIWEIDPEEWDDVLAVNLRGVLFGCQLVGPLMKERGWGRIVNLASLAGQQGGLVAGAHYAASKAGIIVLTKIFARELAPHGVTVNAVSPAAIDGPIMSAMPKERVREMAASIPVQRVGQPHEVALLVAYLASDEAGYITGATMDINGGILMR